jgi:hypothetical protein
MKVEIMMLAIQEQEVRAERSVELLIAEWQGREACFYLPALPAPAG